VQTVAWHLAVASAVLLADAAASELASAFASRGYDESLLGQDHIRDIEHLYNDGSGSEHTGNSRNAELNTFGSCIQQYASRVSSFQHNAE
jgi:hypothetical protein